MAAVQMNVRIDEDVKARGDEVFARAGFTPSQVVRAVWEYAEQTGEVPAFMRASGADADEGGTTTQDRPCRIRGRIYGRNFFLDHGLPMPKRKERLGLKTLRDELYDDMLEEMGL